MRSRQVVAFLASVLALVALMGTGVASASDGSRFVPLEPVAGNSAYLVYAQNTGDCTRADISLHVRDADGVTRTLTLGRSLQNLYNESGCNGVGGFSLSGSTLSIDFFGSDSDPSTVFWWDLARSRHGSARVPAKFDGLWAGSIRGGWLYTNKQQNTKDTKLIREGTGGRITAYGTYDSFSQVTTGTRGLLLVSGRGAKTTLRYLAYGTAKPVQLAAPPRNNNGVYCSAPTSKFAACASLSADDDDYPTAFTQGITPLDGSTTSTCQTCYGKLGDTFAYTTVSPRGVTGALSDGRLRTYRPDGSTITGPGHGFTPYPHSPIFTAYGKLLVVHASGNITEQTSVTTRQHLLLKG